MLLLKRKFTRKAFIVMIDRFIVNLYCGSRFGACVCACVCVCVCVYPTYHMVNINFCISMSSCMCVGLAVFEIFLK